MKNKDLILVRGISGSGKNTFAELMSNNNAPVFSADDYFMKDGKYKFDGSKIKFAHEYCHNMTETAMRTHEPKIFVANTFTREWEMKKYYELAKKYGYRVFSIVVENRHGSKNLHGVPEQKVQQMRDRFEIQM